MEIIIGNEKDKNKLSYENALLSYAYGRVTLNTEWFLFLLPSIFYYFHHSIEVSIKTLLRLKDIKYSTRNQDGGHTICLLLKKVVDSGLYSDSVNQLLLNSDLMSLLKAMDNSYTDHKYEYPGYDLKEVPLRDLVDNIIFIIFQEVNKILKDKKYALALLYIPKIMEESFLYKLNNPISYCVLENRDD